MSKFELTSHQIKDLKLLFGDMPENIFFNFIDCLKLYLESGDFDNNLKEDNANRQILALKQANLLKDIANQAQKLKTMINKLDNSRISTIDCEVGEVNFNKIKDNKELAEALEAIKNTQQAIPKNERHITNYYCRYSTQERIESPEDRFETLLDNYENALFEAFSDLRITDNLDVWIDESIGFSFMLSNTFGSGYLETFLHSATVNWADFVKLPIKYSESSLFIKYLAILLETPSTEKLSKIASRSKWLRKNRASIDFRISIKHGTILSESEVAVQSKASENRKKDQSYIDEKVKAEINKIKGN